VFVKIRDQHYTIPFVKTFAQVAAGKMLCYLGSNGTLEIAINQKSAAETLSGAVGDTILVTFS